MAEKANLRETREEHDNKADSLNLSVSIPSASLANRTEERESLVLDGNKGEEKASPSTSTSIRSTGEYVDVFKGLETRDWYYRGRDPVTKDRIQRMVREKNLTPLDKRLTLLLDLKKGDLFSFRENEEYRRLQGIYSDSELLDIVFVKGEQVPILNWATVPTDTPVCILKFNRDPQFDFISTHLSFTVESSEVVEISDRIRGVRIVTSDYGKKSYWIRSFECLVYEQESSQSLFRRLAIIHFAVTIGIDGDIH